MTRQEEREAEEYLRSEGIDEVTGEWGELMSELNRRNQWDNPEKLVMMKDAIERMSAEAMAVIGIVFNAPKELADFLMQKPGYTKGSMTRYDLWSYLSWHGLKHTTIRKAFSEIQCLLDESDSEEEDDTDREEDRKLVHSYFALKDWLATCGS